MEFKAGDRVHVSKFCWVNVDFYATLQETTTFLGHRLYRLANCTNLVYQNNVVWRENSDLYGDRDYYTLATDEEDTEEPVIQRITDTVNHPSHYNFGDIEVVDFIEQVTKHYNSDVAYHIGNAIKYLARSPHKNGKEDIAKAKWYIERAFDKWE
ncbi:DUF3310 domain-containing protein [Mammaliicoccus sciuri]|uniref:DUF3310 domain-containing protein n=1 Tax=Mammaliicoccus sciuri TaxID=1296 RepID=UPI002886DA57|nr:DUF3310 domain-containing protein [Mammaliicoccus sciuri]MDT0707329.1 DUF3310 domain-containing protein [Mammaliicoccus sciuri]